MGEDELKVLIEAAFDLEKSLTTMTAQMDQMRQKFAKYKIELTAGLDQAASTAQIQADLKNVNTVNNHVRLVGKVDKAATQTEVSAALKNLKNTEIKISGVLDSKSVKKQLEHISKANTKTEVEINGSEQVDGLSTSMDKAGSSAEGMAAKLYLARTALQMLQRAAQEAKQTVIELDKAATDLAIVTGNSGEDAYELLTEYNTMAKQLGATTTQVSDAATEWLRQGKTAAETTALIEQSMILSKVGAMGAETATENLTSAMKGYGLAVEDVSGIVDKLTAIDLKAAVTASDLAVAMSRTANSANISGVNMNRLLGYIAAVQEVTQKSAETIGESFKTIFARMGNIKLGKYLDDEGEDLSDVESVLKSFGIALRNSEGNFRSYSGVLDEVYAKWNQFGNIDKRAIASAFAGTRQQENFLVLMENYGKALEYAGVAADSAGTALEKFAAYEDSIEAKAATFTAAMESLTMDTVDADAVKDLIDAGTAVVEFVEQTGLLKTTLASLGAGAALKGIKMISDGLTSAKQRVVNLGAAINTLRDIQNVGNLAGDTISHLGKLTKGLGDEQLKLVFTSRQLSSSQIEAILTASGLTTQQAKQKIETLGLAASQKAATATTVGLSGAMTGLGASIKAAFATNPIGMIMLGVSAISMAVQALTAHIEEQNNAAIESGEAYWEMASGIEDYKAEIETLKTSLASGNLSQEEAYDARSRLLEIQDELIEKYGQEAAGLNLLTTSADEANASLDNLTEAQARRNLADNEDAYKRAAKQMEKQYGYTRSLISVKNNQEIMDEIQKIADQYENMFIVDKEGENPRITITGDTTEAQQALNDLYDTILKFDNDDGALDSIQDSIKHELSGLNDIIDTYGDIYEQSLIEAIRIDPDANKIMNEVTAFTNAINSAIEAGDWSTVETNLINLDNIDLSVIDDESIRDYIDQAIQQAIDGVDKYEIEIELETKFKNDKKTQDNVKKYLESMFSDKNGNVDVGLIKNMSLDITAGTEEQQQAFRVLSQMLEGYEADIIDVVNWMAQQGIITTQVTDETQAETSAVNELDDAISDLSNSCENLKSAMSEMLSGKGISSDTALAIFQELKEAGQDTADFFDMENGRLKLNIKAYQDYIKAKAEAELGLDDLRGKQAEYLSEINSLDKYAPAGSEARRKYQEAVDGYSNVTAEIEIYEAAIREAIKTTDIFYESFDAGMDSIATITEISDAIKSGDFTNQDMISWMQQIPELAKYYDATTNSILNQDEALQSIVNSYYDDFLAGVNEELANNTELTAEERVQLLAMAGAFREAAAAALDADFDIDVETDSFDALVKALEESSSAAGMSAESIAALRQRYSELDGYDPAKLFEKTAGGIRVNTEAMRELEKAYQSAKHKELSQDLSRLEDQYASLTIQIDSCADEQERALLYEKRKNVLNQIRDVATLAAEYDGLCSAYNEWQNAQSKHTKYDDVSGAFEDIRDLIDRGFGKSEEVTSFLEYITGKDFSASSAKEVADTFGALDKKIQGTTYSLADFWTENEDGDTTAQGMYNLLDAMTQLGYATEDNGFFTFDFDSVEGGIEAVASALGLGTEALEDLLYAAQDAGLIVDFDSMFSDVELFESRLERAKQAVEAFNGILDDDHQLDITFNYDSVEDANAEMKQAKALWKWLTTNDDGTINLDAEGADEALNIMETIALRKQALEYPTIMTFDFSTANLSGEALSAIASLQKLIAEQATLKVQLDLGLDEAASNTYAEMQSIVADLQNTDPAVWVELGVEDTIDLSSINSTLSSIDNVEATITSTFDPEGTDAAEDAVEDVPDEKTTTLKTSGVSTYIRSMNNAASAANSIPKTVKTSVYETTYKNTVKVSDSNDGAGGAARAFGTAYAGGKGNWGAKKTQRALIGEIAPEIMVDPYTGTWQIVGANGAEFVTVPKGAIIFNHKQTSALLKYGKILGRGKVFGDGLAYANGTANGAAYASGAGSFYIKDSSFSSYNGSSSGSSSSSSSSSSASYAAAVAETFEDLYNYHQHLLKMNQESDYDYFMWLSDAYKKAYESGQIELEDFYKYEEEVYDKRKELYDDFFNDTEHQIGLLSHHDGTTDEQIALYQQMMDEAHNQAELYRAEGLDDNHEFIQELQNQWWEYHDRIDELLQDTFDDWLNDQKFAVEQLAINGGDADDIVDSWQTIIDRIEREIDYWRSRGYDETSDVIQDLVEDLQDAKDSVIEALDDIVAKFDDALSEVTSFKSTLEDFAKEYAENGGFVSIDTVQELLSYGAQYMQYLYDENGLLTINEEKINAVIAAKTEQLALENALAYVEKLKIALNNQDMVQLNNLLYATTESTNATWGLVYAQLALLDLSSEQFNAAIHNINAIRSLANTAVSGIGQVAGQASQELEDMQDGLNDILEYVMDILKQRTEDQIDALEEMKGAYSAVIDQRKEALKLAKEETDRQKTLASKMKEMAKLQAKLDLLELDDSREAQAEKAALLEELADLEEDLADTQAKQAIDAQENALDKMKDAYEAEKDQEIEILENSISSYQKLYDMAISYIQNNWDNLYSELINWNTEYGTVLNSEITTAWENCLAAAQRYGDYVTALNSIGGDIESMQSGTGNLTVGQAVTEDVDIVKALVSQMKEYSAEWSPNNTEEQNKALHAKAAALASRLDQFGIHAEYNDGNGVWTITRDDLNPGNVNKKLYDCYHEGGIVGGGDIKSNEQFALLKNDEWALTKDMVDNFIDHIKQINTLGAVLKDSIDVIGTRKVFGGVDKLSKDTINNITNNSQPVQISIGDTNINGAVMGYKELAENLSKYTIVTRNMVNQIAKQIGQKW